MEQLNINQLLNRNQNEEDLIHFLNHFEENKHNLLIKRGVYVYGDPGSGKTYFVEKILKQLNYDTIKYDAGDIRNKSVIDTITKKSMNEQTIISMFKKQKKKLAIIMDEIDGMNSGDKGGINSLIKLIRPKKTKKQKLENITMVPIICISNYHQDKKIKEMMKMCTKIELKIPTKEQIKNISSLLMPDLNDNIMNNIISVINGDLRKLKTSYEIYQNQSTILKNKIIKNVFQSKSSNIDTKDITKKLLNNKYSIGAHPIIMNETDRTSVGLLYHENIIDVLENFDKKETIPFYIDILGNTCFSDYIDRITFQKQIWIFNEMSSLVKTFYNNKLLQEFKDNQNKKIKYNPAEVRFTKVLTKYSTEYNNMLFIQNLCFAFNMDQSDLLSYFIDLRNNLSLNDIYEKFSESHDINKLDINRVYRYIDNFVYDKYSINAE